MYKPQCKYKNSIVRCTVSRSLINRRWFLTAVLKITCTLSMKANSSYLDCSIQGLSLVYDYWVTCIGSTNPVPSRWFIRSIGSRLSQIEPINWTNLYSTQVHWRLHVQVWRKSFACLLLLLVVTEHAFVSPLCLYESILALVAKFLYLYIYRVLV